MGGIVVSAFLGQMVSLAIGLLIFWALARIIISYSVEHLDWDKLQAQKVWRACYLFMVLATVGTIFFSISNYGPRNNVTPSRNMVIPKTVTEPAKIQDLAPPIRTEEESLQKFRDTMEENKR